MNGCGNAVREAVRARKDAAAKHKAKGTMPSLDPGTPLNVPKTKKTKQRVPAKGPKRTKGTTGGEKSRLNGVIRAIEEVIPEGLRQKDLH